MPLETEEYTCHPRPRPPCGAAYVLMDMDTTNLDGSWSLDQIFDADTGEPSSPFLLSVSEQRLWDFSDDNSNGNTITGADCRPLESSRIPYYGDNIDLINESTRGNDDTEKLPSPFIGLMPDDNRDGPCIIKEKLTQALRHFKDLTEQHHVLAQVWVPVTKGGRYMLTTSGQPFVLDPNSNGLHQYRLISLMYMFSVDGDADGELGLPGRVFRQKLPEWTPNVQYYSSKEFPRLAHALYYNVQGTLALPIFEPSRQSCVGVLELIMTSQKINYAPEVAKICKALEAASLKSSEILDYQSTQICNEGRQNALAEILEIITVVCETYTLPLAQTWIPCLHHSVLTDGGGLKKACSSFDGSCMGQVCMSTTEVAFYVVDARMWGFREACAEHHLQKGQGVAGKAFASHNACFCQDITEFCKTEYPLVHYARMFGLKASFAICLQSNHTGNDDYILEFFLPPNHQSHSDKQTMLESLLDTIKPYFRSLRVASGEDLDYGWISIENIRASADENDNLRSDFVAAFPLEPRPLNDETVDLNTFEGQVLSDELNAIDAANGDAGCCIEVQNATAVAEGKDAGKKPGRKRGKAEKTISLEVLRQYFVGSLKDAAKSLGVCPTTMKRICRQHGISRWPSRKINKVNRSLTKLKRVIESVQGGEGTFQLTSLDSPSIPDPVGPVANFNGMKQLTSPGSGPSGFREEKRAIAVNINSCEDRFLPVEAPKRSRTGSGSRDGNRGTSASQGSCQHSPYLGNQTSPQNDPVVSAFNEQLAEVIGSHEPTCQQLGEMNISASFSFPGEFLQLTEEQLGQMPIEEVGSSHDLKTLCPPTEDAFHEHATESSCTIPSCPELSAKDRLAAPAGRRHPFAARPEVKTITIKATYREDIIRFRLPLDSTLIKLREEVSKRLKLELLTFDIKYLDDDHEWVLIACDSDLQECVEITRSSGGHMIRLLVGDIMANLGSSCDSSGE